MKGILAPRYQARIESSALHGTYGGVADSVVMALDFLNLAMQAEGADNIAFTEHAATRSGPQEGGAKEG